IDIDRVDELSGRMPTRCYTLPMKWSSTIAAWIRASISASFSWPAKNCLATIAGASGWSGIFSFTRRNETA
ncbi:MAG TPA: hypothetical protein VK972_10215, partial [Wenzhouxiangella sp.]|nr:hypothetical protein [Wenzhouxiangella sp.]